MICPSCGKENYGDVNRCYNCGTDFHAYQQGQVDQQFQAVPMGPPSQEEKKGMPTWGIVLIVVGSIFVLGVIIFVAASVMYMWSTGMAETEGSVSIMSFDVKDGVNMDEEHGCFFTIRAKRSVDIDPTKYSFYVSEEGGAPKKLDFAFRDYQDQTPAGGDRNKSYRFDDKNWKIEDMNSEAAYALLSDGEYIGFDMPKANMRMDIEEGNVYEVLIKDPGMTVVYEGAFVYQEQTSS